MNRELCTGCSACAAACPNRAVSMVRDSDGFLYPQKDKNRCTGCGRCDQVCPLSVPPEPPCFESRFFALCARPRELRLQSTSGGAFRLLAEDVLSRGGAVFGASFDEKLHVRQTMAGTENQLLPLLGTKYVQSDPGDSFREALSLLSAGRETLYSGSPCAVHGLLKLTGGVRDHLLAVDHICYGVPSPGFWEAYVSHLTRLQGAVPERFQFRDKRRPDSGHTLSYSVGGCEHVENLNENRWCRLMFKNISLRSSCLNCRYCTASRESDVTIGDFWGIEKCRPGLDDGYGVSLVIVHSRAGMEALERILPRCDWSEVTAEQAHQPRLCECAKAPILRKLFFGELMRAGGAGHCDMELLLKKYGA